MRNRILGGTILGLVLFALGSVGVYRLLERDWRQIESLTRLYFPLQERAAELRLLLERLHSLVDALLAGDRLREPELRYVTGRIRAALEERLSSPDTELSRELEALREAWLGCEQLQRAYAKRAAEGSDADAWRTLLELEQAAARMDRQTDRFEGILTSRRRQALAQASSDRSSLRQLFAAMVATAIVLGAAANVFFYRALLPLQGLVEAVRTITRGQYEVEVPVPGGQELAFLAGEFNTMAAALVEQRRALVRSQEVLRATLDGIRDVLLVHDVQGNVLYANPAARALAESKGDEGHGCILPVLGLSGSCPGVPTDARVEPRPTLQVIRDPETGKSYEVSCQPVMTGAEEGSLVVELVRDITEKLQMERLLWRSEKLSAIGELALGVAHEVRNPLSTIQMTLHTLSKRSDLRHGERERVDLALREVGRLEDLVSSLLDYGRPSEPRAVLLCLDELIQRCVSLVEPESARCRVEVAASARGRLPRVEADPDQVTQVLVNLLLNAVQASPAGAQVRIGAELDGAGGAVSVAVADSGPGIEAEELKRIFTPFFTTKRDGTGLGLPVARKISEAHGGELTLESAPGQGTTARLVLPLRRAAVPSEAAPTEDPADA